MISGCAAEVMGDIDFRVGGRVTEFGKSIGDMNALRLWSVKYLENGFGRHTDNLDAPSLPSYRQFRNC